MTTLRDLPAEAWDEVKTPASGYNYRAEVAVGHLRLVALLDTRATTNAIAEEVVVDLIDRALAEGLVPKDREWPIRLERWGNPETVTGVAKNQALRIVGAVVLPVTFRGIDGRESTHKMRFNIFEKGSCGWMGLVIGGPCLEPPPLGLGLKAHGGGHYFETLGLTLKRLEEAEVWQRMDSYYALHENDEPKEERRGSPCLEVNLWLGDTDTEEEANEKKRVLSQEDRGEVDEVGPAMGTPFPIRDETENRVAVPQAWNAATQGQKVWPRRASESKQEGVAHFAEGVHRGWVPGVEGGDCNSAREVEATMGKNEEPPDGDRTRWCDDKEGDPGAKKAEDWRGCEPGGVPVAPQLPISHQRWPVRRRVGRVLKEGGCLPPGRNPCTLR